MTQDAADLVARPEGYLVGIIDDPYLCDRAVEDLAKVGLGVDRVVTYIGAEGAAQLAATEPSGFLERVALLINAGAMESESVERYRRAAQAGQCVIAAHVPDEDERMRALDLLRMHSAHELCYYAGSSVERYD
jgi:hypothetical protein